MKPSNSKTTDKSAVDLNISIRRRESWEAIRHTTASGLGRFHCVSGRRPPSSTSAALLSSTKTGPSRLPTASTMFKWMTCCCAWASTTWLPTRRNTLTSNVKCSSWRCTHSLICALSSTIWRCCASPIRFGSSPTSSPFACRKETAISSVTQRSLQVGVAFTKMDRYHRKCSKCPFQSSITQNARACSAVRAT